MQFPIARAYANVRAADLMRFEAARLFDAGKPAGAEANMAKLLAADASWEAANVCLQTFGGFGFAAEYDVERKFRETRLYQVAPISTNLILSYIGEHVLGMPTVFLNHEARNTSLSTSRSVIRRSFERSMLYVPASRPNMIEKAAASDADAVCIDLEDAVTVDEKPASRANVVRAFRELDFGRQAAKRFASTGSTRRSPIAISSRWSKRWATGSTSS